MPIVTKRVITIINNIIFKHVTRYYIIYQGCYNNSKDKRLASENQNYSNNNNNKSLTPSKSKL